MTPELRDALMAAAPGEAEKELFQLFAPFALTHFSEEIKNYRWVSSVTLYGLCSMIRS